MKTTNNDSKNFSSKKWNTFSTNKKILILKNHFLTLEKTILQKENSSEILDIFAGFTHLLENETDERLQKIYALTMDVIVHSPPPYPPPLILRGGGLSLLYDKLRPIFNEEIILQKDFHFLPKITKTDEEKNAEKLPIILILDNLRSAFNVGSIFRTAECLNISEILLCGLTPTPLNEKVKNTAMGTENKVKWTAFTETKEAILYAKENGYKVYALETVENARSIYDIVLSSYIAFVLGNEALGIPEEVILACDECLQLPLLGWKNSLNVATACAVACFEVYRQQTKSIAHP